MRKANMLLTGSPIYFNEKYNDKQFYDSQVLHERPQRSKKGLWSCCSPDIDNYSETSAFSQNGIKIRKAQSNGYAIQPFKRQPRQSNKSEVSSLYHLTPIKTQSPEEAANMYQNGYWTPEDIAQFTNRKKTDDTPLRMHKTQSSSPITPGQGPVQKRYVASPDGLGLVEVTTKASISEKKQDPK